MKYNWFVSFVIETPSPTTFGNLLVTCKELEIEQHLNSVLSNMSTLGYATVLFYKKLED